ncbi:hypothetical protein [Endozoicomonas ascidiicola]|nr:hypothetical protein [Endozoicomonas ascidiicola]
MIKVKGGIYDSSGGGERFKLVIENRGTSQEYAMFDLQIFNFAWK